jgi:hypothetical protein
VQQALSKGAPGLTKQFTKQQIRDQIASEIIQVSRMLSGTPDQRFKGAKAIVSALLKTSYKDLNKFKAQTRNYAIRQAEEVIDQPNKSYTSVPNVNTTAKNITPPPQSLYQTQKECEEAMIKIGISPEVAKTGCSAFFDKQTDETRSGNTKNFTNATLKQGSTSITEIPSWAVLSSGLSISELERRFPSESNIKSADTMTPEYKAMISGGGIAVNAAHRQAKEDAKEEAASIKSAAKKKDIPAWAILAGYEG